MCESYKNPFAELYIGIKMSRLISRQLYRQEGVNLCLNPSAEDDLNADGNPDYWRAYSSEILIVSEFVWCTIGHSGLRSLVVKAQPDPNIPEYKAVSWRQRWDLNDTLCPVTRGQHYRLRCWVQTQNADGRLYVHFWDENWNFLAADGKRVLARSPAPDVWVQTGWIEFTVPTNAAYAAFGIGLSLLDIDEGATEGAVRGDDFELELTALPPPPPPCSEYVTQSACETANCYWWDDACHQDPYIPPEDEPTVRAPFFPRLREALISIPVFAQLFEQVDALLESRQFPVTEGVGF